MKCTNYKIYTVYWTVSCPNLEYPPRSFHPARDPVFTQQGDGLRMGGMADGALMVEASWSAIPRQGEVMTA